MVQNAKQVSPENKALLAQSLTFMALSKNAYDLAATQAPDGWKIIAGSNNRQVEGFFARLYERRDASGRPHYAIAFRGTDKLTDLKDMEADVKIALLRLPHQYENARRFVESVCREKKINPADLSFTGHSLGGYLAATVGASFNSRNIWTFNAPAPDIRIWHRIEKSRNSACPAVPGAGWVNIRSTGDIIGKWGYYKGATTIGIETPGAPHGLDALQGAVRQIIAGEPVRAARVAPKSGFLSRVFNAVASGVSRALARSKTISLVISFVMADGFRSFMPHVNLPRPRLFAPRPSMA